MATEYQDQILYFAYGSNMSTKRLRAPNRVPQAKTAGRALLHGYGLRWHKKGDDGTGKCDVLPSPGEDVHGVLFWIPKEGLAALDRAEGAASGHYERRELTVESEAHGGAVLATTYVAVPAKVVAGLRPYECYKAHVLCGAREHGLPVGYVEVLARAESKPCPPAHRCS